LLSFILLSLAFNGKTAIFVAQIITIDKANGQLDNDEHTRQSTAGVFSMTSKIPRLFLIGSILCLGNLATAQTGSDTLQTAAEINKQAMELVVEGKMQEAVETFVKAIKTDSTFVQAYINLGFIFYSNGVLDKAIGLYQTALQIDPENALGHNNLGAAYMAQGRFRESILEFRQAIKSRPDYGEAYNNIAFAFHSLGFQDDAIQAANKALENRPDYALAYNNLGLAFHAKGEYDEAVLQFNKALEQSPNLITARNNLGQSYRALGRLDECREQHMKALELDTLNTDTYNNLGMVYLAENDMATAIKYFSKVLEIAPKSAVAHNNLSFCYYELLDYAMAIQHAVAAERTGMKVNPDYMADLNKALDTSYIRARHILVNTKEEADELLLKIRNGENFAVLADQHSIDAGTASRGGEFGYVQKGDLQPQLEDEILKLEKEQISEVIETELGFHIFQRLK
jgi:tetratricopeptide (TPR) repeat protein